MSELKTKEFKSPSAMLQWQWRSMIEELNELQRHASDPTCPCVLADSGEYCLQKHALGLHTLAKETIAMAPEHTEMLEELAEESLDQHNLLNERIVCGKPSTDERDTVVWSRQWRKKLEQLYYRQGCKIKVAGMKQDLEVGKADMKNHTYIEAIVSHGNKSKKIKFLVDTGASMSHITQQDIEELGLIYAGSTPVSGTDSTNVKKAYVGMLDYDGIKTLEFFMPSNTPLIGVMTLESRRLKVNPASMKVERIDDNPRTMYDSSHAEMHFDPLLSAIGCQIGVGCMASSEKISKLPVCDKAQRKERERIIKAIKETLPSGCNSKEWNKPLNERQEGCVNPYAIASVSAGCRIGKKR